ncbi:hypothetical protein HYH02_009320 [Chlamydomonas schloesseri]|uniref:F-box domain-containing protein n=1 Tax=Chlamydomonas schloesseri TaxID=2026947 RepID=A0A835W7B9_9CHLO|nr:hypothetical protein HYH02_009320 [Chlamydomonas schloesseri]|eukprot:KAG2443247.1 hypothetical protein HYH02_009320 [Chlamydomonas schloesseri]
MEAANAAECASSASDPAARSLPLDVVLRICSHLPNNEVAVTSRLLCKEARAHFATARRVDAGALCDVDPLDTTSASDLHRVGYIGGVPVHAVRWLILHADADARGWLTLRQRFWLLDRTMGTAAPAAAGAPTTSPAGRRQEEHSGQAAAALPGGSSGAAADAATPVALASMRPTMPHQLWRQPLGGLAASAAEWAQPPLLPRPPRLPPPPPSASAAKLCGSGQGVRRYRARGSSGNSSSIDDGGGGGGGNTSNTGGGGGSFCPVSEYANTPPRLLLESMSYTLLDPVCVCRDALLAAAQWGDTDALTLLARDGLFRQTMCGDHCRHQDHNSTNSDNSNSDNSNSNRGVALADLTWAFCSGRVAPELLTWMFGGRAAVAGGDTDSAGGEAETAGSAPFAEWRHSDVPYLAAAVQLQRAWGLHDEGEQGAAGGAAAGGGSSSTSHRQQRQHKGQQQQQRARTHALLDHLRAVGGFGFDKAATGGPCGGGGGRTFLRAVWLAATVLGPQQGADLLSWLLARGCPTGPPGWAYAAAMFPPPVGVATYPNHNSRTSTQLPGADAAGPPPPQQQQQLLTQAPVLEWLLAAGVPLGPDARRCVDRFWLLAECHSRYLQWVAEHNCGSNGGCSTGGGGGDESSGGRNGGWRGIKVARKRAQKRQAAVGADAAGGGDLSAGAVSGAPNTTGGGGEPVLALRPSSHKKFKRGKRRGPKALRRLLQSCACGGGGGGSNLDKYDVQCRPAAPGAQPLAPPEHGAERQRAHGSGAALPPPEELLLGVGRPRGLNPGSEACVALARLLTAVPDVCWCSSGPRGVLNGVPGGPLDRALAHMRRLQGNRRPPPPPQVVATAADAEAQRGEEAGLVGERGS